MKKLLFSLLLIAAPVTGFAQLTVKSDGSVLAGTDDLGSFFIQLGSSSTKTTGYNIGVAGKSVITGYSGISCGVWGRAQNVNNGMTYGVAGDLHSYCTAGAGIVGSNMGILGYIISGKYAGYFYGNTYVNGTLTATQVQQTSDKRLKENITPLYTTEKSTLSKLLDMNIVSFNYSPKMLTRNLPDSVSVEEAAKCTGISPDKKHIGLIAQELQALYPDLVEEGQDGYLTVNYIELIPILIRSVQELNQKVEDLENASSREATMSRSVTDNNNTKTSINILYQNTPNPFKEQTVIRFSLADDAHDAAICIFDMTGKMLKRLPISSGETSVSINGWELGEGMFLYTLIVNGHEIDTKRMILLK